MNFIFFILIALILPFLMDPLWFLLLGAAIFSRQLKKELPEIKLKGIHLFEYAIKHEDENVQKIASKGIICQITYCALWIIGIFLALFFSPKILSPLLILLILLLVLFTWIGYQCLRLLLFKQTRNTQKQ